MAAPSARGLSRSRFVRIDRRRLDDLAGRVDDRDLDAGAKAWIEVDRRPAAGRRGEQEVAQVRGEHFHRLVLGLGPDAQAQVDRELSLDLGPPRPAEASRATSVPLPPIATPMWAALSEGASLTPSPIIATTSPSALSALTIRSFWSGMMRANTLAAPISRFSPSSPMLSSAWPVMMRVASSPAWRAMAAAVSG
jgi:hypothetical protein